MSIDIASLCLELVRWLGKSSLGVLFVKCFSVENGKQNILFKSINILFGFEETMLLFSYNCCLQLILLVGLIILLVF